MTDESTPWATGLTVAGFVAAVTAVAVVVLSLGPDPGASAAGRRTECRGGRRTGADAVGMAAHAGAALACAGGRSGRDGCVAGAGRDGCRASAARWSAPRAARLPTPVPAGLPRRLRVGSALGSAGVAGGLRTGAGSGSSKSSWATGATGRSSGRSKFGSISSLAASSTAVTVPPCAPGQNRKCARLSDRPAFQPSCTVQRPSSLRQASQVVLSGFRPRAISDEVTVSSSVSTDGPSASTGWAAVASSAARERSSNTGWANR